MKKTLKPANQVEVQVTLTEKELEVLKGITTSDFYEYENAAVWDYSVLDFLSFSGKTRSGVISSLEQKGLLNVTKKEKGDIAGVFQMTELGFKTFQQATAVVEEVVVVSKVGKGKSTVIKPSADMIVIDDLTSKTGDELLTEALDKTKREAKLANFKISQVGNTKVGIITKPKVVVKELTNKMAVANFDLVNDSRKAKSAPKTNSKVNYNKMSYQELAKAFGNGFVGKNKQTLIDLLTKGGK